MTNLPTDLLRTLVTVVERGGFTTAGEQLGRSQPAISLQIKRLEELLGITLFERNGRQLSPTDNGRLALTYARQMLALNDELIVRLNRPAVAGGIRLGVPNEFAGSFLPEILGRFAQAYPDVALEVGCDLSTNLLARLGKGEFDLVFALHRTAPEAPASEGWTEDLVWVTSPRHSSHGRSPLPLIVAPRGCVYRERVIETLDRLGRPWRIVYTSPSFGGIKAGVQAGLGVTVLARSTVPDGLQTLGIADRFPELPPIRVALHYDRARASEALLRLVEFMATRLGELRGEGSLPQTP